MKQTPLILSTLLLSGTAHAEVTPHPLFCDHAVLQRDTEVPVWGFSNKEGEKVSVSIDDKPAVVTTAKDGKWMVKLPANPAGGPHTLTIAGDNKVVLSDILIGEVWICSGQSNMEMNFSHHSYNVKIPDADAQMQASALPGLRFLNIKHGASVTPLDRIDDKWLPATPESAKNFSLTGQYFGRELKKALGDGVPVGLIASDVGGTCVEAWTSREGLERSPKVAEREFTNFEKAQKDYLVLLEKFNAEKDSLMAAHAEAVAKAKAENKKAPPAPKPPIDPAKNSNSPTVLYNAMIAPLVPYAFKGVIWYQGESNKGRAREYSTSFPNMIADWREKWGRGDFPFLFVQVAPFNGMPPEIREAQFLSLKAAPNSAMVQTIDVGEANNIHPWNKEPVGKRLALAARNLAYGEKKLEFSGPLFAGATFIGGKAIVSFTHADKGLELKEVKYGDFQVAGADKRLHPATATIEGGKLVVTSPEVTAPTAVRYGWSNVPNAALWNKDGLPASPFRSDEGAEDPVPGITLVFPEETIDQWMGHPRHNFTVAGRKAWVIEPTNPLPGKVWTWCTEFPTAFTARTGVPDLLKQGVYHVHFSDFNQLGCEAQLKRMDEFYAALRKAGLAEKPALIGLSRGGFMAYRWAEANPEKIACIYGDAPVCDLKSWPAGLGKGQKDKGTLALACELFGWKTDEDIKAFKGNALDEEPLKKLADKKVPLLHVVGDRDNVVPVAENTAILAERYKKLGGDITVLHHDAGHHPHGLDDPKPVVEFILKNLKAANGVK